MYVHIAISNVVTGKQITLSGRSICTYIVFCRHVWSLVIYIVKAKPVHLSLIGLSVCMYLSVCTYKTNKYASNSYMN